MISFNSHCHPFRYYHYAHFTDEDTDTEKRVDLAKVKSWVSRSTYLTLQAWEHWWELINTATAVRTVALTYPEATYLASSHIGNMAKK